MSKKIFIFYTDKIIISIFKVLFNNRLFRKIIKLYDDAKLPKFGSLGINTQINQPFFCFNPQLVSIGSNCRIGKDCEFGVTPDKPDKPKIIIGNNVWVTTRLQIFAKKEVKIGDDVIIASNVFIGDYSHGYSNVNKPFKNQPFEPSEPISIGRGSWIGQNSVILHGVKIGEFCIIGSNSVVTKSIPDKCIIAGSPAKIIKIWDDTNDSWVKPII